jgi:uncharacterized damage-inducible protein DinB
MPLTDFFRAQLDREANVSKGVLAKVPEGRSDWKPHEKSMPLGYLATLVATMPAWIAMTVAQDSLDLQPPSGAGWRPPDWKTAADLLRNHDAAVAQARDALRGTTDAHLGTPWKLLVAGQVVMEAPRDVVIADTFTHLAHHRGQLSVYLRLTGATVPSMYGPSADDRRYAPPGSGS